MKKPAKKNKNHRRKFAGHNVVTFTKVWLIIQLFYDLSTQRRKKSVISYYTRFKLKQQYPFRQFIEKTITKMNHEGTIP
jgi:hypothetical protein